MLFVLFRHCLNEDDTPRDGLWAEPLFNLIFLRTSLKSTIITTWLDFDKWNQNFVDKVIAATIVDMNRPSFRIKATKEWIYDGKNRHLGVMIIIPRSMAIVESGVIERTVFPDRTAFAKIAYNGAEYIILSLHSITGCAYGKSKPTQFYAFAEAIEALRPDIVTFDANEPAKDHYDIFQMDFFDNGDTGEGARTFFGSLSSSGLSDAFAINYDKKQYVDGQPLATSHILHGRIKRRYDFIFVNESHIVVRNCRYRYDKGCELSSDHAIIVTGTIEK